MAFIERSTPPRLLEWLALLVVGCAAPVPRIVIGASAFDDARRVGSMGVWEGPSEFGDDLIEEDRGVVITSSAEHRTSIVELWSDRGEVMLSRAEFDGMGASGTSDGQGNVVFFGRRSEDTPVGRRFRLEHETFTAQIRRGEPWRPLDLLAGHDYYDLPPLCGGSGLMTAWVTKKDTRQVAVLPTKEPLPFADKAQMPTFCAYGKDCSSIAYLEGDTNIVETTCGGVRRKTAAKHELLSTTRLYPSGAHVTWNSHGTQSQLWLAAADGRTRTRVVDGAVYAVTRWDEERYFVHVARRAPDGMDLSAYLFEVGDAKPQTLPSLNDARAGWDRKVWPELALLPSSGNGRPVLVRVGNAPVLITGDGAVWAWDGK